MNNTHPAPVPNPQEPYAGFGQDVAKHERRIAEIAVAASAALPGPLREAFAGEPRSLHGFTFQPVTAGLMAILTRIKSPLLDIVRIYRVNAGKSAAEIQEIIAKELNPEPEAMIETVFCFVTPIRELRAALAKGRDAFRESVMQKIGDKIHPVHLADLEHACGEHFAASFSTVINHEAPKGDGETVFTPPPATPMTASAGG